MVPSIPSSSSLLLLQVSPDKQISFPVENIILGDPTLLLVKKFNVRTRGSVKLPHQFSQLQLTRITNPKQPKIWFTILTHQNPNLFNSFLAPFTRSKIKFLHPRSPIDIAREKKTSQHTFLKCAKNYRNSNGVTIDCESSYHSLKNDDSHALA